MTATPAQRRIRARRRAECLARRTMTELLCIVSILRTALTRLIPLAGAAGWWTALTALLLGAAVLLLAWGILRRTGSPTLHELVRRGLGRAGAALWGVLLTALLLGDACSGLAALTAFFVDGVGTRGTPLTLAALTALALLPCLHGEGLPRAVQLMKRPLCLAAVAIAAVLLPDVRGDGLFPLWGSGVPGVRAALRTGFSLGWPLLLLLTEPPEDAGHPVPPAFPAASLARITLGVTLPLLLLCLTIPHEVLSDRTGLADALLQPVRFAPAGVGLLMHCLLLTALFLSVAAAVLLAAQQLRVPWGHQPGWLPAGLTALLPLSCLAGEETLLRMSDAVSPWALLPVVILLVYAGLCRIPARRRRCP